MTVYDKGLITVVACALLQVVIALPLALRKVPPNPVYGFRTRTTLDNPHVWYEANAYFGRGMLLTSIISMFAVFFLYQSSSIPPDIFLPASVMVLVVPSVISTLVAMRFASRISAGHSNDGRRPH